VSSEGRTGEASKGKEPCAAHEGHMAMQACSQERRNASDRRDARAHLQESSLMEC
jgi:hypothetical protein